MTSRMLEESRRPLCSTTLTSGFRPSMKIRAEAVFAIPIRSVLWITWRCRLEASTTSSSTRPIVPTPAAAVERGRGAEAAGAEQQHLRIQQFQLAVDPDLGKQRVARVALALFCRHPRGRDDRQPLLLPLDDAAAHRSDVLVAELLQLGGGEGGAVAGAAVEDRAGRLVGRRAADLIGEHARRHQLAALEVSLLVLVGLAGVDQDDVAAVDLLRRLEGFDLLNRLQALGVNGHLKVNPLKSDQL